MVKLVEFLWFDGCPSHGPTRKLLAETIEAVAPGTPIVDVDASDPAIAAVLRFPGSPTIRIDGRDIDPRYTDPGDYAPRCRVFLTDEGLSGIRSRARIEDALLG